MQAFGFMGGVNTFQAPVNVFVRGQDNRHVETNDSKVNKGRFTLLNGAVQYQSCDLPSDPNVDIELLEIAFYNLKKAISNAENIIKLFFPLDFELSPGLKRLAELVKAWLNKLKVINELIAITLPNNQGGLYADQRIIIYWNDYTQIISSYKKDLANYTLCENTNHEWISSILKAIKLILRDIESCYKPSLTQAWFEKKQAKMWYEFESHINLDLKIKNTYNPFDALAFELHFPKCIIIHEWENPINAETNLWMHQFAKRLRGVGFRVYSEIWRNQHDHILEFVTNKADFVIHFNASQQIKILLGHSKAIEIPLRFDDWKNNKYFEEFFALIKKLAKNNGFLLEEVEKSYVNFNLSLKKITEDHAHLEEYSKYLKDYYKEQSTIKRLFYKTPLKLQRNYIHLTVVTEAEQSIKEKALRTEQDVKTFDELFKPQHHVNIEDIFELIESSARLQVLITGRAGIGKTTFSKYLSYIWAEVKEAKTDTNDNTWCDKFSLVFTISLRQLISNDYKGQSPIDLLVTHLIKYTKEILPEASGLISSDAKRESLKRQLQLEENAGHILLILDGYDEIAKEISEDMKGALFGLLTARHVILTSRPYHLDDITEKYKFDAKARYRITGFTDGNIKQYIQNFFKELAIPKPESGEKLYKYLREHPSLWGPCHIPINLELVCSTWEMNPFKQSSMTMTELYTSVVDALCFRYLSKYDDDRIREKFKFNKNWKLNELTDIPALCKMELEFLEHWAFTTLNDGHLVSSIEQSLHYIFSKYFGENTDSNSTKWIETKAEFIQNLLEVGFFKSVDDTGITTSTKEYYFPHRTFQEYFAARYFVRYFIEECFFVMKGPLKEDSKPYVYRNYVSTDYIQRYRYDMALEIMWWFVAGLLYKHKNNNLQKFFNCLFAEPCDVLGNYQAMLILRCWDETHAEASLTETIEYFEKTIHIGLQLLLVGENISCLQPLRERLSLSSFVHNSRLFCEFILSKLNDNDEIKSKQIIQFFNKLTVVPTDIVNHFYEKARQNILIEHYLALLFKNKVADEKKEQENSRKLLTSLSKVTLLHFFQKGLPLFFPLVMSLKLPVWFYDLIVTCIKKYEYDKEIQQVALKLFNQIPSESFKQIFSPIVKRFFNISFEIEIKLDCLCLIQRKCSSNEWEEMKQLQEFQDIERDKTTLTSQQYIKFYQLLDEKQRMDTININLLIEALKLSKLKIKEIPLNIIPKEKLREIIHILLIMMVTVKDEISTSIKDILQKNIEFLFATPLNKVTIFFLLTLPDIKENEFLNYIRSVVVLSNPQEKIWVAQLFSGVQRDANINVLDLIASAIKSSAIPIRDLDEIYNQFKIIFNHVAIDKQITILRLLHNVNSALLKELLENNFKKNWDDDINQQVKCLKIFWLLFSGLTLTPEEQISYINSFLNILKDESNYFMQLFVALCLVYWITNEEEPLVPLEPLLFNRTGKRAWCQALLLVRVYAGVNYQCTIKEILKKTDDTLTHIYGYIHNDTVTDHSSIINILATHDLSRTEKRQRLLLTLNSNFINRVEKLGKDLKLNNIDSYFSNQNSTYDISNILAMLRNSQKQQSTQQFKSSIQSNIQQFKQINIDKVMDTTLYTRNKMDSLNKNLLDPDENNLGDYELLSPAVQFMERIIQRNVRSILEPIEDRPYLQYQEESSQHEEANKIELVEDMKFMRSYNKNSIEMQNFHAELHNNLDYYNIVTLNLLHVLDVFNSFKNYPYPNNLIEDFMEYALHAVAFREAMFLSQQDLTEDLTYLDFSNIKLSPLLAYVLQKTPLISIIKKYLEHKDKVFIPVIVARLIQENKALNLVGNSIYLWGKQCDEFELKFNTQERNDFIKELQGAFNKICQEGPSSQSSNSNSNNKEASKISDNIILKGLSSEWEKRSASSGNAPDTSSSSFLNNSMN